jgi:sortase A
MLTMTARHPRFSSRQRYVLFSELDEVVAKSAGQRPGVLG